MVGICKTDPKLQNKTHVVSINNEITFNCKRFPWKPSKRDSCVTNTYFCCKEY